MPILHRHWLPGHRALRRAFEPPALRPEDSCPTDWVANCHNDDLCDDGGRILDRMAASRLGPAADIEVAVSCRSGSTKITSVGPSEQ